MYFYDTPQGIRQAKVRADDAVIVEQSEVKPALVKLVDTVQMLDLWTPRFPRSDRYEFIVPPGSVDRSISFNISDGE